MTTTASAKPTKRPHRPARTCVACREEGDKSDLIRFVRRRDGTVELDPSGKAPGRGAYLHARESCFELARKRRALDRALGAPLTPEQWAQVSNSARAAYLVVRHEGT